ncbi:hypothetical protein J4573_10760 [Actinomadura barringtoniae]|uniref:Uncharacterized protein n=1 Tax=Actinomadura barringtoniae TaxID=1427535 RepID=A0A939PDA7_9ACTN|nr:hypothetical protein [Actinomadura barringtoniae]MBO2447569.1 hypothetical protein [Actinomadura barringtoniae]
MNEHDQDGEAARLLGPLRDFEPEARTELSPRRSLELGRRRSRTRRVAGTTLGALAVMVVVLGSTVLGRTLTHEAKPRPAAVPETFTQGRRAFTIGSGGGFAPGSYDAGAFVQRITLRPENPAGAVKGADGIVELYPRGRLPAALQGKDPSGRTVDPVYGGRTLVLWTPILRPGAVELAWQWKPGAWGLVSLRGPGVDEARAHHVAESVRLAG